MSEYSQREQSIVMVRGREQVSTFTFALFLVYQLDFFLRITTRLGIDSIRPTLLLFAIILVSLILQKSIVSSRLKIPLITTVNVFILTIVLTLPLVEYPGSVVRFHIPEFVKALVFLYFCALILDSPRRFKWALFVFLACQVIRVLEPLYLNMTQGYWGGRTHLGGGEFANRLSGAPVDVINPNELGFVIVTAIPFLHYLLWSGGIIRRVVYLGLIPMLLYALILTMSRGAFVALLVVVFVIWKESRHKVFLILLGFCAMAAGWSVMNDTQKDRYLSLVSSDSQQSVSAEGRLDGIIREFQVGLKNPVFGHGLGTTPEAKVHSGIGPEASHNMYAEILIELGLVGSVFFFVIMHGTYRQIKMGRKWVGQEEVSIVSENVFKAFTVTFWMFVVYSFNYWGLSQYYWYNLAGLVIAANELIGVPQKQKGMR